jgi:glycine/D-amino acid oxidase-like deaminating enzyme
VDNQADVAVIGGGIAGSAIAYNLAKGGAKVVVLEKGEVADEQSGRAWGFVRQQGRSPRELPLMIECNKMWQSLSEELNADIEWVQGGNMAVAYDDARMRQLEEWCKVGQEYGLDVKMLTGKQVQDMIPQARGSFAGGMYTPSDGHAEPVKATTALARAAQENGAQIIANCAVEGIETSNGQVTGVVTEQGLVRAPVVVCAAGAWSPKVARMAGLSLPYRVVRATVTETTPTAPLSPVGFWSPDLSFRQRPNGSFYVASSARSDYDVDLESFRDIRIFWPNFLKNRQNLKINVGRELLRDILRSMPWSAAHKHPFAHTVGVEPRPNQDKVATTMRRFHQVFPSLESVGVKRVWAGRIDATADAVPVMGEVDKLKGFIFATGFSGHGFAMGPIVGRVISELILKGKPSIDLYPLRHSRFKEGDMDQPKAVL